jgi:hypothetical protein
MTLLLFMLICVWLALGCMVAWLLGRISDIGGAKDISNARKEISRGMPREINASKITYEGDAK